MFTDLYFTKIIFPSAVELMNNAYSKASKTRQHFFITHCCPVLFNVSALQSCLRQTIQINIKQ